RFNCTDDILTNTGVVSNDSGDANGDGNIDIADVVTLSAFIGNPDINTVSDKAKIYCDVQSHGNGIDASDVLMIQQYIANVITEF
ncbi:MAG: dockerin type I domain-containing protein, partial [Ruminococcus sp.]